MSSGTATDNRATKRLRFKCLLLVKCLLLGLQGARVSTRHDPGEVGRGELLPASETAGYVATVAVESLGWGTQMSRLAASKRRLS